VAAVTLTLANVTYKYAGSTSEALRSVNLSVEPGRVVGLVGPNGAGKSTLALCAVGLAPSVIGGALTGTVKIDGLDTAKTPAHQLAQHAGILFQESQTQITSGAPSVWEEIAFGPRNLSLSRDEVIERTWTAIGALRLQGIVDRDPGRLSGGQAQLVALAAVIALGPKYLILDEPTSQLDPLGTRLVGETLARAARETGVGILIAEHKTDLLARMCDEIAVINAGGIVARGTPDDILSNPSLLGWGVAPPADVSLRQAVVAAGLKWSDGWP
jgi:energy-coupling factor transport system ATP-binding protein